MWFGFYHEGFCRSWLEVKGVEPNAEMAEYAKSNYGFDVVTKSFEMYQDTSSYDLVLMIQVVAHFCDVRSCIEKAARLLKPGGLLLIETWDKDSIAAKIMGPAWHEYSPPTVTNWFTPIGLKRLCEQFKLRYLHHRKTMKKIDIRHARALLSTKSADSLFIRMIEKFVKLFPEQTAVIYPADDLFYMIFRKSGKHLS